MPHLANERHVPDLSSVYVSRFGSEWMQLLQELGRIRQIVNCINKPLGECWYQDAVIGGTDLFGQG